MSVLLPPVSHTIRCPLINIGSLVGHVHSPVDRERLIILGSGWGGYNLARAVDQDRYDVRIISPSNHFVFTPLLPSTAVGTLEFRCIQEPVRQLTGVGFDQAKARRVDLERGVVVAQDVFEYSRGEFEVCRGCAGLTRMDKL